MLFAIVYFLIGLVMGLGLAMDFIRETKPKGILIQYVIFIIIGLVLWPVCLGVMFWNTFVRW